MNYLDRPERRKVYEKLGRLLFVYDLRFAQAVENILGCSEINYECHFHTADAEVAETIESILQGYKAGSPPAPPRSALSFIISHLKEFVKWH